MRPRSAQALAALFLAWLVPVPLASGGPAFAVGFGVPGPVELTPLKQSVVTNYAALVYASYDDALGGARALAGAIDDFLAAPTEESLGRARHAWIDARVPYAQ